jgi:predicted glycoside hydrolase/deacetylase ChbG (UPF0249 family)
LAPAGTRNPSTRIEGALKRALREPIAWRKGGTAARGELTRQIERARGLMGHTAALIDPHRCVEVLEQAIA